ncbi:MAG TPA: hypothetical protein VKB76_16490 [Ktedonobacterales bacterium]|nr:hypothetical protein [Ktedonobacterales bacterium]
MKVADAARCQPRSPSRRLEFAAKSLKAAAEEILLAAVVGVEGRAANIGFIDDLLHG